jgi:Meiotically up-regulated gene family
MLTGNCWADITGDGCGVFVQGANCTMSGIDMWNTYQKIRAYGCSKCGSWHNGEGCLLTINYITNCGNRDQ